MAENKPPIDDDDDDSELELAPIDPEILAHEKQRAKQLTDSVVGRINVDELFEKEAHADLGIDFSSWRQFRFTTRHLMILTALLALVMTVIHVAGACSGMFWVAVAMLGAGWFWVLQQERRREAERQQRREEFLAGVGRAESMAAAESATTEPAVGPRFDVKFAFSMKQLFFATTVAVVAVGLLTLMGPHNLAWILGLVAIAGIVANIVGIEAAPIVVLGWWLLLVVYLIVGAIAMFTHDDKEDDAAAARATAPSIQTIAKI